MRDPKLDRLVSKFHDQVIEKVAAAFERDIAWHNDECTCAEPAHPWYACNCEVRAQAADIRKLKVKP